MEVVLPRALIETKIDAEGVYTRLERYGRTAYKSEDRITEGSAEKFLRSIIKLGHESIIEHESVIVRFICDRGVTHELVRHRIASFTQESTRYVNYQKRAMQFIQPCFWEKGSHQYARWYNAMEHAENAYLSLIDKGATPQEARSVLPNSLKTEIVVTANIREWRHIFRLRTAKAAHPQMREVMRPLLGAFKVLLPVLFDDIIPD